MCGVVRCVAVALLFATPALADTLILKEGKKVDFRLMRDKGDAVEIETPDGLVQTILKRDIKDVVLVETKQIMAGATITFEGKVKTAELLPLINPKRDTVFGTVRYTGNALVVASEIDAPTLLQVPHKLPEEYDLTFVIERRSTIGNFFLGLVGLGDRQFLIDIDTERGSQTSIIGGPSQRGAVLEKGKAHVVLVQVRRDAVVLTVDKKEILAFKGSPSNLFSPQSHQLPGGKVGLFIGTQRIYGNAEHANFQVSKITMTTKP